MSASTAVTERGASLAPMSFGDMVRMGDALVKTGFLPAHLRTGAQVAAVILTGRELGMEPMRAVRSLSLVKGKVTEAADSQLARFKADGGRAQFTTLTDSAAVLVLRHPNGDEHTETFSLQDAQNAGIATDMYKKYPKAMLRSRAITAGLKSVGWDGAVGNYDPDELPAPLVVTGGSDSAPDADEFVHAETLEPRQLAAPRLTLEDAEAVTVKGKALGTMSTKQLGKIRDWAVGADNARLVAATEIVLAAREDDELTVETLPGSLPMETAA